MAQTARFATIRLGGLHFVQNGYLHRSKMS